MNEQVLITFFSHSGNTQKIAELIHQQMGGTLFEIHPQSSYPKPYKEVVAQAKKEIQMGFHPALKTKCEQIGNYDRIFVGSPNWWSTLAPPVATFLKEHDLSGKVIVPFCTHGGGGTGRIVEDIEKLCPHATILTSLAFYGSGGGNVAAQISTWLNEIGMIH